MECPIQMAPAEKAKNEIREIVRLGESYEKVGGPELAKRIISEDGSVADFRAAIRERLDGYYRHEHNGSTIAERTVTREVDLTPREIEGFSVCRAITALASGRPDGPEVEIVREAANLLASDPKRPAIRPAQYIVPRAILAQPAPGGLRETVAAARGARALQAQTGDGNKLVADSLLAGSYIDFLWSESVIMPRATHIVDLVGDVEIPRQDEEYAAAWVDETSAQTPTDPSFDQVLLSPKTIMAAVTFSHKALRQSTAEHPRLDAGAVDTGEMGGGRAGQGSHRGLRREQPAGGREHPDPDRQQDRAGIGVPPGSPGRAPRGAGRHGEGVGDDPETAAATDARRGGVGSRTALHPARTIPDPPRR